MTLIPAYGRDYASGKDVITDFLSNKDFRVADVSSPWHGSYASLRDIQTYSPEIRTVNLRYRSLERVIQVDIPKA